MSPVSRRIALQAAGGAGLATLAGLTTEMATAAHAPSIALDRGRPGGLDEDVVFTFVSMPDFFNGDVADLSVLPSWDGGPNSVNQSWVAAIDRCLRAVSAHQPDAVFLPGDTVEGRWNLDPQDRQLFGPVSQLIDPESIAMSQSAITVAGGVYYPYVADLFASRQLPLYPGVGDHEILDDRSGPLSDRWSPTGLHHGVPDNRYYLVDHCKSVWADHFTRPGGQPRYARRPRGTAAEFSAYAVSFADALTLITIDPFARQRDGVRLGVFGGQLRWLREEIRRAKRRGHLVVVQGHIPVLAPNRWLHSARLRVPEGRSSSLYQVLDKEGADLYLCGEVHDTTAQQLGRGPVQICHGCIFRYGFSYLVGRLHRGGTLELDLYEAPVTTASLERGLWSTDPKKWQRTFIEYGAPVHRGRLVQQGRQVLRRTQKLGDYRAHDDPFALRGHLPTVLV